MMQSREIHVDVLVIGAGPAGASAARQAVSDGANVLMVDRRRSPASPVQCAEWVPRNIVHLPVARECVVQQVYEMESHVNGGEVGTAMFGGAMLERKKFDVGLQNLAGEKGVTIWHGACFKGFTTKKNTALVLKDGQVYAVHYKVMIAADGPASRVAHHMGLPGLELIHALQYSVPLPKLTTTVSIWLSPEYFGGYAWMFPKGEIAHVGVGFETGKMENGMRIQLQSSLEELLDSLLADGLVGDTILAKTGGAIPVSGLRDPLVKDCVLFAGDAAGCTNPLTGAGISSAILSGEMAGDAAREYLEGQEVNVLLHYQEELRDVLSPGLLRDAGSRERLKQCWQQPGGYVPDQVKQCWVGFDVYRYARTEEDQVNGMC